MKNKTLVACVIIFSSQCYAISPATVDDISWSVSPHLLRKEKTLDETLVLVEYGIAVEFNAYFRANGRQVPGCGCSGSVVKHEAAKSRWPCCPAGPPFDDDPDCWVLAKDMFGKWGFTKTKNGGYSDKNGTWTYYCGLGNHSVTYYSWIPSDDSWHWYVGIAENEATYVGTVAYLVFRHKLPYKDEWFETGIVGWDGKWSYICSGQQGGDWGRLPTQPYAGGLIDGCANKDLVGLLSSATNYDVNDGNYSAPLERTPYANCIFEQIGWNQYYEPNYYNAVSNVFIYESPDANFCYPYIYVLDENNQYYNIAEDDCFILASKEANGLIVSTLPIKFQKCGLLYVSDFVLPVSSYCSTGIKYDVFGNDYRFILMLENGSLDIETDWIFDKNFDGKVNLVDFTGVNSIVEDYSFFEDYLHSFRPIVNLEDMALVMKFTNDYEQVGCFCSNYLKRPR
jgi:hypothetical protein